MATALAKQGLKWWQWTAFPLLAAVLVLAFTWVGPAVSGFQSPSAARIVFVHVPVAMLLSYWYVVAAVCAFRYLTSRKPGWDARTAAAAEVGLVCTALAAVSGAIFARIQWNSWWHWDPKQTAIVAVLMIYFAYFTLRGAVVDSELRARVSAVYAILGGAAAPVIIKIMPHLVTTIHPQGTVGFTPGLEGGMSPDYRIVFYLSLAGFFWVTSWFYLLRVRLNEREA